MENRITPDFITSLKENEIFVFGCRRSGRHWEGAAAFAFGHPEQHFLVTRIGCGLGGWRISQIAPMFRDASLLIMYGCLKSFGMN